MEFLKIQNSICITYYCNFKFWILFKDFRLDASSETLLIEGDPDLAYLKEVTERYGSKDFLILTYTPNEGMVTDSSINNLIKFKI